MSKRSTNLNFKNQATGKTSLDFLGFKPSSNLDFKHLASGFSTLNFVLYNPTSLLNFTSEITAPSSVLNFGKSAPVDPVDHDVSISINAVIKLNGKAELKSDLPIVAVFIAANIDLNPIGSARIGYDSNVFRGSTAHTTDSFQQSKVAAIHASEYFDPTDIAVLSRSNNWQQSQLLSSNTELNYDSGKKLNAYPSVFIFEQSAFNSTSSESLYEAQKFQYLSKSLDYEQAVFIADELSLLYEAMTRVNIHSRSTGEYSKLVGIPIISTVLSGVLTNKSHKELFEQARYPYYEYRVPDVDPVDPEDGYNKDATLHFNCRWYQPDANIDFNANCQPQPAPPKGVLFVTNSVSLNRTDDGSDIKMLGFSVGIDSGSYAWSFSATLPLSELSKVDIAHEQRIGVDFTCNGNLWRFILDSCEDSIAFGERALSIKGKSRAILLAHPYAAQRGFKYSAPMSARQIAEDELNRNGVPSGFTLDWQLAGVNGWQIPANTYSYSNKTPINSLQWIAEAAGGFINADMSQDIIHVLAHYQIPSWEWAAQTPSINLTQSVITSRSRGRSNKPSYNGVLLYGENDNGIGALVKRRGTSGGYQPPMITSDLMTDTDAAISRGKMVLSDTGYIGNIGISMPLIADIGVLKPSTLIGVNDGESWVGMVRGTTITGRLSSNKALEIDQSIDVERHFDKEIANG